MKTGLIFEQTATRTEKVIIHQGGKWSGKTYGLIQLAFVKAMLNPGFVITITGQDIPNIKRSSRRDAEDIYYRNPEIKENFKYNSSESIFKNLHNGAVIEFAAYEHEQDAKAGKRHILFIDEAQGLPWDIARMLMANTSEQTWIAYNPTAPFWAHDKLFGAPDTIRFISDHRHNPFIPKTKHDEIESYSDPEFFRVYARGLTGNLRGIIYPGWHVIDEFPSDIEHIFWGVDFGYTVGATAIIKIGYQKPDKIYLHECAYLPGIQPEVIKQIILHNGGQEGQMLYCDHDPDMVRDLRKVGLAAVYAQKGELSEWNGILCVKRFNVSYTARSENIHRERGRYKFIEINDTMTNQVENTKDFHAMAAIRMGLYTHFSREE